MSEPETVGEWEEKPGSPPGSFRLGLASALAGGDRGEEYPESGRPVQREPGDVFEQHPMPHLDRLLLNHAGAPEDVRHTAPLALDGDRHVRLPRELDVRALELHERLGPSEGADHGALRRAVEGLRRIPGIL